MFRTLRERGYDAVPVNPNATEIDGEPCYARLRRFKPPVQGRWLMVKSECRREGG